MSTYQIYGKKANTLIHSIQEKMTVNRFLKYVYLPRETTSVHIQTCTYMHIFHICIYVHVHIYDNFKVCKSFVTD